MSSKFCGKKYPKESEPILINPFAGSPINPWPGPRCDLCADLCTCGEPRGLPMLSFFASRAQTSPYALYPWDWGSRASPCNKHTTAKHSPDCSLRQGAGGTEFACFGSRTCFLRWLYKCLQAYFSQKSEEHIKTIEKHWFLRQICYVKK